MVAVQSRSKPKKGKSSRAKQTSAYAIQTRQVKET